MLRNLAKVTQLVSDRAIHSTNIIGCPSCDRIQSFRKSSGLSFRVLRPLLSQPSKCGSQSHNLSPTQHFSHILCKANQKTLSPQGQVSSQRTAISLGWVGPRLPVSEPGIKCQFTGFWTCKLNREGRAPTPNKGFRGTPYNKWKAGRKGGKEGEKEGRQDLLSFSFVSYAVQGPFTYISLLSPLF